MQIFLSSLATVQPGGMSKVGQECWNIWLLKACQVFRQCEAACTGQNSLSSYSVVDSRHTCARCGLSSSRARRSMPSVQCSVEWCLVPAAYSPASRFLFVVRTGIFLLSLEMVLLDQCRWRVGAKWVCSAIKKNDRSQNRELKMLCYWRYRSSAARSVNASRRETTHRNDVMNWCLCVNVGAKSVLS